MIVETHSDGVNPLWDNGSVPMLAIARYFATLPRRCRPGPMEFVLTTAHLYQRLDGRSHGAGDELYARRIDRPTTAAPCSSCSRWSTSAPISGRPCRAAAGGPA